MMWLYIGLAVLFASMLGTTLAMLLFTKKMGKKLGYGLQDGIQSYMNEQDAIMNERVKRTKF